ncbi:hypothetical protein G7Y89_g4914 [Cudoniella acicularis]|uniref:Uncharacterized protein n=1 Tax=Cudoniella acicularis TaxID=354080 RepID=A0A8H4W3V3_9HELO|nr:hypothetical protein G7Y89_g4914 [Cudoniella acicularis]
MSSDEVLSRRHRHTRSAAAVSAGIPPSQHPRNPHHLNSQAHEQNSSSEMKYPAQPTTPPRTPRRDNQSQSTGKSNTQENGSRQKSRNKNRPKNVMTSPAVKINDRSTPPLTGAQSAGMPSSAKPINTPSSAVYAGATFHASPAPSALPIPSFYSKSVPDSPSVRGLKSVKESSSPGLSQSPSPPVASTSVNKFDREESPLDFFFKADREEKERARSASSANMTGTASSPFQPPSQYPRTSQTPPVSNSQNPAHREHASKNSAGGMFAMELDGPFNPSTPFGPAFSTPYSERINAARTATTPAHDDSQQPLDRSEALKAYLFSEHTISPPGAPWHSFQSYPGSAGASTRPGIVATPEHEGRVFSSLVMSYDKEETLVSALSKIFGGNNFSLRFQNDRWMITAPRALTEDELTSLKEDRVVSTLITQYANEESSTSF